MKRIGITVALLFCMGTGSLFAQAYKVVEKLPSGMSLRSPAISWLLLRLVRWKRRVSNAWKV